MKEKYAEYLFFFGLFAAVGYIMWQIVSPFITVFLLSAVIATVSYPFYLRVLAATPRQSQPIASIITVLLIACLVFIPLFILSYVLFVQAVAFYDQLSFGDMSIVRALDPVEAMLASYLPGFSINVESIVTQAASFLTSHTGTIFAGTASTAFMVIVLLITIFYMFKDGPQFVKTLVRLSPLQDIEDHYIIDKLSVSIRSVVLGTLVVALIQGCLSAVGFAIFGINQPVLWGSVAAIAALIPGVGTSIVFIGAIGFSLLSGNIVAAIGLTVWGVFAVGLIDNLLGPYLMSRGAKLHPFAVFVSVIGGIGFFGPVGFLIGPVALSFFVVMVELATTRIRQRSGGSTA